MVSDEFELAFPHASELHLETWPVNEKGMILNHEHFGQFESVIIDIRILADELFTQFTQPVNHAKVSTATRQRSPERLRRLEQRLRI